MVWNESSWAIICLRAGTAKKAEMKWKRIAYWLVTVPLIAMMLFATFNYIFNYELIVEVFHKLGFPTYIIYPLAVAKLLGVIAIVANRSSVLKEWAYAGFFFNFLIALSAHINVSDGQFAPALICLVLLIASYILDKATGRSELD
jgi:hypothetical protein